MMKWLAGALAAATAAACGSANHTTTGAPGDAPPTTADAARTIDGPVSRPDAAPDAASYRFLCDAPPPEGAPTPTSPPPPTAGCPTLAAGLDTMTSSNVTRQFQLVIPANLQPDEHPPVLVLWYWLGGSADDFITTGMVQQAADDERFIAVVPVDIGATVFGTSFNTRWPFDITQSQQRMDQEFTFFDDMLACVEEDFAVNRNCVSSVGVSAGALFTDQLAQARSTTLASFISLSGGVDDTIIKPWAGGARALPGIVLWGGNGPPAQAGVRDILGCFGVGMDFATASADLETALTSDGNFFVECIHDCGHTVPPIDPPPGESQFAGLWEFALNHPYWLPAGQSPYASGLPPELPPWCGIGKGGATPRMAGDCPADPNPCTN